MTDKDKQIITRINKYAEEVLADIDPQKTQVSVQIEKLRPILTTIAKEEGISLEEMFIKYMDLASEFAVDRENNFQADLKEGMSTFSQQANRLD